MSASVGRVNSGDGWVFGPDGDRYWGRFGAAGLLIVRADRNVLLQHRVEWSHHGGTWGVPGGARHQGETAEEAAYREAAEEAGVPREALRLRFSSVFDLGFWSYTTVVADAVGPFTASVSDVESIEVRWVPADEVVSLPLHPAFALAWPGLLAEL